MRKCFLAGIIAIALVAPAAHAADLRSPSPYGLGLQNQAPEPRSHGMQVPQNDFSGRGYSVSPTPRQTWENQYGSGYTKNSPYGHTYEKGCYNPYGC